MNIKEYMKVRGRIRLRLFGPDGVLKQEVVEENIITNAGRQAIIDRMQANTPAAPDYVAIGTGGTAEAASQTALVAEVAREQGSLTQPDAHTARCTATFDAGTGTGTITECGLFNASSGPTMFGRKLFGSSVVKGASDSLTVEYDLTYAAS